MSVLAWIVLGVGCGVIAGRMANRAGLGFAAEIMLGISGCLMLGGLAYRFVDGLDVTPLHCWSVGASMAIAVILLAAHHAAIATVRAP